MESLVAEALHQSGIDFVREGSVGNTVRLDFYLPAHDLYIEVKRFHSDRIAAQMARAPNVIALQGEGAIRAFCHLIKS